VLSGYVSLIWLVELVNELDLAKVV